MEVVNGCEIQPSAQAKTEHPTEDRTQPHVSRTEYAILNPRSGSGVNVLNKAIHHCWNLLVWCILKTIWQGP